jgi:3-(3-hydroxy-phenyl)propionate hydroxylase
MSTGRSTTGRSTATMRNDEPCVVVGAGPVGLVAALALRRRGLSVLVLEAEPAGRARPGSRAIFLGYPTLRRLEQVLPGLGEAVGTAGMQVLGYDAFYGGRRVFHQRMRPAPPLRWGRSLPQVRTEEIVYAEAVRHGVQFRWDAPVAGVSTGEHGATVELASGERISTPYVIAADGARSAVRKALGTAMDGDTDDTPFIIVDVDEHPDGSTPTTSGYFHYGCPELAGRNVMHMPFAGGMRVDLQCLPTDDAEYLASPDGVREWVSRVLDPWYAEHVRWISAYRFHQVVARSFTDPARRVLLAGEAAHLFAPWGGRGLNSGVIDATDAAWAIADAVAADDPALARRHIARCAAERRRWALHNRDVSSRALRIMRGSDPVMRLRRAVAARVAPVFWPAGAWLANGPVQLPPRAALGAGPVALGSPTVY